MSNTSLDEYESDVAIDFFARNTALVSNVHVRSAVGDLLANALNVRVPRLVGQATPSADMLLPTLKAEGFAALGRMLGQPEIDDIFAAVRTLPVYNREIAYQGDGVPRRVGDTAEQFRLGGYRMQDVVELPHLLELALHPSVLSTVEAYLNATPTLALVSSWWSFPCENEPQPFPQNFHRDSDDFRFITLFIYLTDVGLGGGPHQYIRGSHDLERFTQVASGITHQARSPASYFDGLNGTPDRNNEYLNTFSPLMCTIVGPAGTAFLGDNYGLHRGLPPTHTPRLLFAARYGIFRNANEIHRLGEGYTRIPWARRMPGVSPDERLRYITRLILEPPPV